ncbi:MAG: Holliday junction branch migration DNA helicase RuvB [Candidatus Giovannonibacteria bacterium]|nr:MAG: Holliday junction branch migration DNA helicase RuvB [Candidatus Giovannonibacteria bacterium]
MSSVSQNIELSPKKKSEDLSLDVALRPKSFEEYVGQDKVKRNLKILIEAAKKRGEPLEHLLFYGPAGLGKTTLAYLIAKETASQIKITSGPAVEKIGDLASILTNLSPGDILFIDEAHRLNKLIEEILYPAMENRSLDIIIGKGPSARTIQLELPPFTLIAATTRIALLSSPLRSRFSGGAFRLDFYNQPDIEKIIKRSAGILSVQIEAGAVPLIASRSRFTPRIANRLLKRARDFAEVKGPPAGGGVVTSALAEEALKLLEIDELGLEAVDRKILDTIIRKFAGGPVGLSTISASTMEEEDTIEEIYEPYLMQLGFLERTPRGRLATPRAYEHLGLKAPSDQQKLI